MPAVERALSPAARSMEDGHRALEKVYYQGRFVMATAPTIRHPRARKKFNLSDHKFFLLFAYLLAVLIYYPYVHEGSLTYGIFRVGGSIGILLVLYAARVRRTLLICAIALAVPAVLQQLLRFRPDAGLFSLIDIVLSFAFDVFIVALIFRQVFAEQQVRSETIFGAITIYLLIGYSFASVYEMIATVQARAFYLDPITNLHTVPNRFDFIYYSFATMTSVGAVGITPVSGQARSFTVIESALGVLYLAVLIARLIADYRQSPPTRTS